MDQETSITLNGNFDMHLEALLLKHSLMKSLAIDTKLHFAIRDMQGMSGKKYRYLINNLIEATNNARYLEVGSWAGSTACSAMYGNRVKVLCIDNWSEFGGPKETFLNNIGAVKPSGAIEFEFLESDFRQVDYKNIGKFNVYLFDGPHTEKDQYDGIHLAQPALDDVFTFIVDDWNWEQVRWGTINALASTNIETICSIEIRTTHDNSHPVICHQNSDWHNGYFIAVCKKKT